MTQARKYADVLARQSPQPSPGAANGILDEFRVFAKQLDEQEAISARIESPGGPVPIPNLHSLVVSPRFRPNEAQRPLNFLVRPNHVEVLGTPSEIVLDSPDAAERFLLKLAGSGTFQSMLDVLRVRYTEPFVATLRRGAPSELTKQDVVLILDLAAQKELATAKPKRTLELTARIAPEPELHLADFDPMARYAFLESSGYLLKVKEVKLGSDRSVLHVTGTPFERPRPHA